MSDPLCGTSPLKTLLTLGAFIEIAAGVAALAVPVLAVSILLGSTLEGAAITVTRIAGAALVAIGIMNWAGRSEPHSNAAKGIGFAMLFYNIAIVGLLLYAFFGAGRSGIGLWPAIAVHAMLAVGCIQSTGSSRQIAGRP